MVQETHGDLKNHHDLDRLVDGMGKIFYSNIDASSGGELIFISHNLMHDQCVPTVDSII